MFAIMGMFDGDITTADIVAGMAPRWLQGPYDPSRFTPPPRHEVRNLPPRPNDPVAGPLAELGTAPPIAMLPAAGYGMGALGASLYDLLRQGDYGEALGEGAVGIAGMAGGRKNIPGVRRARDFLTGARKDEDIFPGVWKTPQQLAEDVRPLISKEDPALSRLFGGTSREELADIAGKETGDIAAKSFLAMAKNPRGSETARGVMTPANAERMQEALEYVRRNMPDLWRGMAGWYVSRPLLSKMIEESGPASAMPLFRRWNFATSPMSAGNPVPEELARGGLLNYLMAKHGPERGAEIFKRFGGSGEEMTNIPGENVTGIPGHSYHGAQVSPVFKWLGDPYGHLSDNPKVASYIRAFGVPRVPGLGMFDEFNVFDSHKARQLGLHMTRGGLPESKGRKADASMAEVQDLGPWLRENVYGPQGLTPRMGQPIEWAMYGPQTGVDTPLGAPKLELLAKHIVENVAPRWGISPERALALFMKGKIYDWSSFAAPLGAAGALGAAATQLPGTYVEQ